MQFQQIGALKAVCLSKR